MEPLFDMTNAPDPLAASVRISEITGCDVVVGYLEGMPRFAWAVAENGLPIAAHGMIDEGLLRKHYADSLSSFGTNHPGSVQFDRLDASAARTLVHDDNMAGRDDKATTDFVERMVNKMRSGQLAAPSDSPHASSNVYHRAI